MDTILNASEEILDVSPTKEWDVGRPHPVASRIATICCRLTSRVPVTSSNTAEFRSFLQDVLNEPRHTSPPPTSPELTLQKRRQSKRA